jgi:hypothetical protein
MTEYVHNKIEHQGTVFGLLVTIRKGCGGEIRKAKTTKIHSQSCVLCPRNTYTEDRAQGKTMGNNPVQLSLVNNGRGLIDEIDCSKHN